jgi:hypothetical protein
VAGTSVPALLNDAAFGRIGVDRRLIRAILSSPDAEDAILQFSRSSHQEHRLDLDPLLVDLFRHFSLSDSLKGAAPLEFYLDAIKRSPEEVSDELVQAIFPYAEKAVDPLLALYEELGEEQGSDIAFVLAGLRVHDPRVLALLLDRLEYDAADGAFLLGLYGDPAARPALEKLLAEVEAQTPAISLPKTPAKTTPPMPPKTPPSAVKSSTPSKSSTPPRLTTPPNPSTSSPNIPSTSRLSTICSLNPSVSISFNPPTPASAPAPPTVSSTPN